MPIHTHNPAAVMFMVARTPAEMLVGARSLRDAELARGRSGHWTYSGCRLETLNAAVEALETIVAREAR
jgi:hypothetical protein